MEKGRSFFIGIFLMYSIQFLYIAGQVIIRLQPLNELGDLFVVYSFFNLVESLTFLLLLLSTGAELNALDHNLKQSFININKDCGRMQIYGDNKKIFRLNKDCKIPKVFILNEVETLDGTIW